MNTDIEYDNILRCKSNPNLLQTIDPKIIIKGSGAKFISCEDREYYFQSRRLPIHENILEFSTRYPDEEFIMEILNVDLYCSVMRTITYKNGECKILKVEPVFYYEYSSQLKEEIGIDRFNFFLTKINSFFEKLKDVFAQEWLESEDALENKKHEEISIQLEDEKFRIVATWDYCSHISIKGLYKVTNQTLWELIDKHSYIPTNPTNYENKPDNDPFGNLPF